VKLDPIREAVHLWLEHIFTSPLWAKTTKRHLNAANVMRACIMKPNHWTNDLLKKVAIDGPNPRIKAEWGHSAKAALRNFQTHTDDSPAKYHGELEDSSSDEEFGYDDDEEGSHDPGAPNEEEAMKYLESRGWKLAENWVPKPIGMV